MILYTNAQSVIRKMGELRVVVVEEQPEVVALTETWTNLDIADDLLKIKGYEMVAREDRSDTQGGRGGGILVYVRDDINAWREDKGHHVSQTKDICLTKWWR